MALVQGSKRPLSSLAKDHGLAALLHAAARSAADATDPELRESTGRVRNRGVVDP